MPGSSSPSTADGSALYPGRIEADGGATLAVFIDRPHLRDQVREDAVIAGYSVIVADRLDAFIRSAPVTAAVVLIDCPAPRPAVLAALTRQDLLAKQSASQIIVSTSLTGLEDVFCCLDQSQPQLLVDPGAADLAIALGRALALTSHSGLRELAESDRRLLLRLAEQVSRLAARLERLETDQAEDKANRLESPALAFRGASEAGVMLSGRALPRLPDSALVRRLLRHRRQRAAFFGDDLFSDPAWDMLLDLTAARGERKRVSVTSLCIAAGVPATTALRWIGQMTEQGLFIRVDDRTDRRRAFIDLSDKAAAGISGYFAALGDDAGLAA